MKIGFLAIGNEILHGKIQEANGPWLATFLRQYGLSLTAQVNCSDSPEDIQDSLKFLYEHCAFVICSGGLGPTPDDVTKIALANFFNKGPIQVSSQAKLVAQEHYRRFDRELPEGHGYGFLPKDFVALHNPSGFAPGLLLQEKEHLLLAAPGVPKEFRDMLMSHLPKLVALHSKEDLVFLNFRTKGIPEEKIFNELCPGLWERLATFGSVSSLPHPYSVDVGITLRGSAEELKVSESEIHDIIKNSPLKPHIWSVGLVSLEEIIIKEAAQKNLTFSFAESCTGGLCASRITNFSGSSQVFWGAVVSYDNSVKENVLGVSVDSLSQFGAVSEIVAKQMADGVRNKLNTQLSVSLTGIAGPGGGTTEKPVGTVWIGLSNGKNTKAHKFQFKGDREALKYRFSQVALFHLLDLIRDWRD